MSEQIINACVKKREISCNKNSENHKKVTPYFLTLSLIAFFFLPLPCVLPQTEALQPLPEIRRATPVSRALKEASDDIRLAPINSSDPAKLVEAQLAVANGFFSRQQWGVAASEYEKFLQMSTPGQPHRDQAFFRLGECRRQLGNSFAAEEIYQQLLKEIPSGAMAAAAAFRSAEYYQGRQETKSAMEAYAQAATLSSDLEIKNAARYQQALCCRELGEEKEALSLFDAVAQEENPNRNNARMALAETQKKEGHPEEALISYQALAHDTVGTVKAEALVKAAMIAHELGKTDQAPQLFGEAAALSDGGEWSGVAALGLMKLAYEAKDYNATLQKSEQAITRSNLEGRAQALFLSAQARRQLGQLKEALPLYDQVLREFPGTEPARDALFARLLVLQGLHDPTLLAQIEEARLATTDPLQRSKIQLLKAEILFQEEKYAPAAEAYSTIKASSLSADLKANALYKEAWCLKQIGDLQGSLALLSEWLTSNPTSAQIPAILMEHGSLEQKSKDLPTALLDYSKVIEEYPQAPERELALQQKALLQGEQQDNKGMRATFQQLLASYPKTKAEAQGNFWIGCSFFEEKAYAAAIPFLEKARTLDSKSFGERSGLRLLLCHYYLEQVPETFQEAATLKLESLPVELLRWLGLKSYAQKNWAQADHWLTALSQSGKEELLTVEVEAALAQTLIEEKKFQEAEAPALKSLNLASDPASRAEALLRLATLQKELHKNTEAMKSVQDALLLQPEGTLNIQARLLQADILLDQGDCDGAARAYRAAALLTADPQINSQALSKAAEAYRRANNIPEAEKTMKEATSRESR